MQLKTNKYTPVGTSGWRNFDLSLLTVFTFRTVQCVQFSTVMYNNYYVLPHNMLFKIVNLSRCSETGL